jgi:hypothetical protein
MKSLRCSILFGSETMARDFDYALFAFINSKSAQAPSSGRQGKIAHFDKPRPRCRIVEADCPEVLREVRKLAGIPGI